MSSELVEFKDVQETEVSVTRPSEANLEFRSRLKSDVLENVKKRAPALAHEMLSDATVAINFGQDVMQGINDISIRLLREQEETDIPEADSIVNNVLRELDGYSAKYNEYKEPGRVSKFFSRLSNKTKETAYDLKAMVRDSKPIEQRLDEAVGQILKMELDIDENIERSRQLREMTLNSVDDIALVIAIFEEIIEVVSAKALEANELLLAAEAAGESTVEFDGKKYSIEQFREVLADIVSAEGEIEKTWFNWRQKYFLSIVNVASTREIINSSMGLKRTANRVRVDAIPAARNQLASWQLAVRMEQSADMVSKTNEGMERIMLGASRGQLSAAEAAAEANQRVMLSEETILEMTENLKKQFETITQAEIDGRANRAKNLEIIRKSEEALKQASAEAQNRLIKDSMKQLSGESLEGITSEGEEMLKVESGKSEDLADFLE